MISALVIAVFLPFFLVKNFSHHSSNSYTQAILLPQPIETPIVTEPIKAPPQRTTAVPLDKPQPFIKKAIEPKKNKEGAWQIINPKPGDSMASIFNRLGLGAKTLTTVLQKNPYAKALGRIKPNQKLQFFIKNHILEKMIIPVDAVKTLTIYRVGNQYKIQVDSKKTTAHHHYITAIIKGSLYNTAQRYSIPAKLIHQMTEILNREIDFSHAIHPGDRFSMVYDAYYVDNKMVGIGNVVAISYTNKAKTIQVMRYTRPNGQYDYYTPQGNSLKKAFSRYPIKFSHISSTFALSRNHPILHYKRAHKGIDLAAPIGTPIRSTGDGVITIIDRHNGYGNMIKIKHDKTYSTIYGHMLRFQKGLSRGSKVKRGQIIGYVGQTGLATGPHCHYELHVNNQPKNPTTTALPTAAPVPYRELKTFKIKAGTLLARLKSFEQSNLAGLHSKKNMDIG